MSESALKYGIIGNHESGNKTVTMLSAKTKHVIKTGTKNKTIIP
jgi:hypothetical protein